MWLPSGRARSKPPAQSAREGGLRRVFRLPSGFLGDSARRQSTTAQRWTTTATSDWPRGGRLSRRSRPGSRRTSEKRRRPRRECNDLPRVQWRAPRGIPSALRVPKCFALLVVTGRFERPTPCAQGTRAGSKGYIVSRLFLTFTTNWGICSSLKRRPPRFD